jgi:malonate transporter and related proteins
MATAAGALAPVFLIIALGWVLRRRGLPAAAFWPEAERLVYFLLLPALLFLTTAASDLSGFRILPVSLALIVAILLTSAMALLLRPWLGLTDAAFTSVFQGAIRTNTYVGLAAAAALFGDAGLVVMGIVVLVVISTVNLLSVLVLTRLGGQGAAWRDAAGVVVRNPLILACVAGFAVNATGLPLPTVAAATVDALGRASLALGLLCVGAGLELGRLAEDRRAMVATCGLKLLLMPVATLLFCRLFGVEGITAAAAVLFASVPVSASSYILARQLGGDAPLMATLITATTVAAVLTMPLVLAFVR